MQLLTRMIAAQAVIDTFLDREFEWGVTDCAALAAMALRELGHPDPLAQVGNYTTERGAKRALLKLGFRSLEAVLDSLNLERIGPASAQAGDIVSLPADDANWSALGVVVDQDRVLAFITRDDVTRCEWGSIAAVTTAWRAL